MFKPLVSAFVCLALFIPSSSFAATTAFSPGELIKGSLATVYYFAPNGKRLVFPNEKTYFTWYKDFSTVKTIPDGQLSTIPLGGNVTYRPGVKMIKITTDPKAYAVDEGGVLRHVASEQLAQTIFGLNWKNKIEDLPDAFFTNYRTGNPISASTEYNAADVMTRTTTIAQDKQLDLNKATVTIGSVQNSFVPTTITIKKGSTITWTNGDVLSHAVKGAGFDSGIIESGGTYSRTFSTVGSFDYYCTFHSGNQGTINVVN